jgi:hypothetical protein
LKTSDSKLNITGIIILLTAAAIIILLAPSERTLGDTVKAVYIHGAMIWVSLMLFAITGAIGITQLIKPNNSKDTYLLGFEETAAGFWLTSTILGFIVAYVTWGGIIWAEPRIWMAVLITILSISIYIISRFHGNPALNRTLAVILAITAGGLLINAGRILHPENPIFQSEPIIQITFIALTIIFFTTALLTARILSKP